MIEELCPDGVEFAKLEDVCVFRRGTSLASANAVSGEVPVVSGGRTPAFYHNVANRQAGCITVASSGTAGYVCYLDVPVFCADSFTVEPANGSLMTKYIYYYLYNNQERIYSLRTRGAISHVYSKHIADFMIPVPPIEVQQETYLASKLV